ncbi:Predicted dehydrogenase [Amphibacillus marinus]|uniref:Predicted dehydrogenase n=1 Tax=Amphibacillus marinus TaxID=872970 RepID=A0A1H8KHM7_9BACI|nr:Gfo/Idh/MocA family oxidoreductase [Amphibacillus marinus]SEN91918.1 Predicted dehydrogenase [Amphibacillus marinus]
MKLGIVGNGKIVKEFLTFINDLPEVELKAIVGRESRLSLLKELQDTYRIEQVYTNYQAFLDDPEINTVYICLPNHLHYAYTKEALLKGKHVICEKPFTSNLQEFTELKELALEKGLILLEAITNQYLVNYRTLREQVKDLGEIKIVECNYSQYSSRYDAFKAGEVLPAFDPAMSGGALMDLNVYNLHFVVGIFGKPATVQYLANMERGIDTSGILVLDYTNFKVVCVGAKDCSAPVQTTIQGNKGSILVKGPTSICATFEKISNDGSREIFDHNVHQHRMYEEFYYFNQIIDELNYDKAAAMLEHSQIVMELVDQAKVSAGLVFAADQS